MRCAQYQSYQITVCSTIASHCNITLTHGTSSHCTWSYDHSGHRGIWPERLRHDSEQHDVTQVMISFSIAQYIVHIPWLMHALNLGFPEEVESGYRRPGGNLCRRVAGSGSRSRSLRIVSLQRHRPLASASRCSYSSRPSCLGGRFELMQLRSLSIPRRYPTHLKSSGFDIKLDSNHMASGFERLSLHSSMLCRHEAFNRGRAGSIA